MSKCKKCRYGFDSGMDNIIGCQYLLHRNEERGCPAGDDCTRFESTGGKPRNTIRREERKQMKKLTEENKREIITLRASGMKVTEIAQKFGVDKSSVYNVLKDYEKHGESAFTAATDTEKEPATAATETGSKQETCEDIPANIIPEKSEDVKPSHDFSPLTAESIWKKIEELREEAIELVYAESSFDKIIKDCKEKIRCLDDQLIRVEAEIDILMGDYEAVMGGEAV
ncbi:MAG: helix-turn-helix domain-containing protein [Huintestinicola sp.]